MAIFSPVAIPGRWRSGFALDKHTVSSAYIGDDEYGHAMYDTVRTDLGNLLYRLKYDSDLSVVNEVVDAATDFMRSWSPGVELIVPIPPSRKRSVQPTIILAEALGQRLGIPTVQNCVTRVKDIPELKNVYEYGKRVRLLEGVHAVDRVAVEGRRVLIFDDLYRSGATMNNVAASLYDGGRVADVFALTITYTRIMR